MKETNEVLVYACGYCGKLYHNREQADTCHADRTCSACGVVIGKESYKTLCSSCEHTKKLNKLTEKINNATRMTYDEYVNEYPNYPVVYNDDYYLDDYDYLLEKIEEFEDTEPMIWGTTKKVETLDAYAIIERFEEGVELEDYSMDKEEVDAIVKFCNEWNEKYGVDVYYENSKILIILED